MPSDQVFVRFLGPADAFEEGGYVLEKDGLPFPVDADRLDLLQSLPDCEFVVVDDDDAAAEHEALEPKLAPGQAEAEAAAAAKAEAEAAKRAAFYGAQSQAEIDALDEPADEPEPELLLGADEDESDDFDDDELDADDEPDEG